MVSPWQFRSLAAEACACDGSRARGETCKYVDQHQPWATGATTTTLATTTTTTARSMTCPRPTKPGTFLA
eukprot:2617092-Pyramimonas_sp.AAC.2